MTSKCFLLDKDYTHSGDPERDAFCIPFPGIGNFGPNMMGIKDFDHPEKLFFTANFEVIPEYDYPTTDLSTPIVSIRMLDVLLNIRPFKIKTIPAIMIDDSYLKDQFDKNGKLKPDVPFIDQYVALQLKEYTEAFNKERSKYNESLIFPGKVGVIENLVLKEPSDGFPPLFKIKERMDLLLVSDETKKALEKAKIKGCEFKPVDVS